MTNQQKIKKLAKELGATIEDASGGTTYTYNIDAPHGYTWAADGGLHCIVAWCYRGDKSWCDEMWADALERMQCGIEKCDEIDCEMCDEID